MRLGQVTIFLMLSAFSCSDHATINGASPGGAKDLEQASEKPVEPAEPAEPALPANGLPAKPLLDQSKAYLHVNLWVKFHNFRSRCGVEKSFAWMCQKIKGQHPNIDCSESQKRDNECNPNDMEYGFVGPEKQDAEHSDLCGSGKFGDESGCDYKKWDLENKLRFYWFGPHWGDNYPVSTLKIFAGTGKKYTDNGEIIGLSNLQFDKGRDSSGVESQGTAIGAACVLAHKQGANRYHSPFGAFAWVEVPVGQPVTVVGVVGAMFQKFNDFARDGNEPNTLTSGTTPAAFWAAHPPLGARREGKSIYVEEFTFQAGKQYYWGHGSIQEAQSIPQDVLDGFKIVNKSANSASDCYPMAPY